MADKTRKIALYGGSFDPPHKGHIEIMRRLCSEFDKVIVMPGYISPFKQQAKSASAFDRLNMLKAAIDEEKIAAEVSSYEIDKGGVSYTYQTVEHLLSTLKLSGDSLLDYRLNDSVLNNSSLNDFSLYFVVGSESLSTLHLWNNIDYLKQNVSFYVIPRQNHIQSTSSSLKGFAIETAPYTVKDYSSSLFKVAHAFGTSQNMVNKSVFDYICAQNLYDDYRHFTDSFATFNLDENRIQHTFRAVKAGITLAKIHGESVEKTITALILHDIGKNATPHMLTSLGITQNDMSSVPLPCRHAIIGADIAAQFFKIDEPDIINAILYHTTCRPNMSRLEKITALADYIEDGRSFSGREAVYFTAKDNLNKAIALMLRGVINHLNNLNKEVCDISLKALCFYNALVYNNNLD